MFMRKISAIAILSVLVVVCSVMDAAVADDRVRNDEAVAAVMKADPGLREAAVQVSEDQVHGNRPIVTEDSRVTLSGHSLASVPVGDAHREGYSVSLPLTGVASDMEVSSTGVVVIDNHNGSKTVPVPRKDGSLQINTVIESSNAPTAYSYGFVVPGVVEVREESGSILFFDKEGNMLAGVAPAWARDVKGNAVPTHYEVSGTVVTQVVEHRGWNSYPIVADPWLGMWLFQEFSNSRKVYQNQVVYSAMLTPWGWSVYTGSSVPGGLPAGYAIVRNFGWSEWKQRLLGLNPAATIEQQYVCHARFGYAIWKSGFHWDLEAARPSKPDWTRNPFQHMCNW